MKNRKILILEKILKHFATRALKRFKPRVVGVTGSVGKTSTKEAIYTVLVAKFRVRKSEKNYNNEIGIPLTVLGIESGGSSIVGWAIVIMRAIFISFFSSRKKYPEILVIEMGADRPGDIRYLVNFLKPEIGVITTIGISHLEYFKDRKQIAREKGNLVRVLNKEDLAVLNYDDLEVREMKEIVKSKKILYGFSENADVRASDIFFGYEKVPDNLGGEVDKIRGISFKLSYEGATMPVRLVRSIGRPQIYSVLAAAAVGIHFGMNLLEISEAVKNFQPPVGRLNIIDGIKNSIIIEDSYNAAPQSTLAALEVLEKIKARRKIAALGNMLELGADTEIGHREIGKRVAEVAHILFAVGDKAQFIADEAVRSGLDKNNVFCYGSSSRAGKEIQRIIEEGDVILVKGSQGARMEKISEEIIRTPEEADKLLPRQSAEWK
jgi:UDP-N-acetylmuramoyl-tripeptide--D-alanyl-D-alanine ligase